jgi:hypothetical protein
MAQVVKCLLCKHKALSSNSRPDQKKKKHMRKKRYVISHVIVNHFLPLQLLLPFLLRPRASEQEDSPPGLLPIQANGDNGGYKHPWFTLIPIVLGQRQAPILCKMPAWLVPLHQPKKWS